MKASMRVELPLAFALALSAALAPLPSALGQEKRTPEQLEQELFGNDRQVRSKAFWEAVDQGCLSEDVWLRLLELRFATVEEEEEVLHMAAYALARCGTARCLPQIVRMLERTPRATVKSDSGRTIARYDYPGEAALAHWRITGVAIRAAVDAHLSGRAPADRASELVRLFTRGQPGYASIRPPSSPEQAPVTWRLGLSHRIASLGPVGASALARAIETERRPDVRWRLCHALRDRFAGDPIKSAESDPARRTALLSSDRSTVRSARRAVLASADPKVRAAVRRAVVAVVRSDPLDPREDAVFGLVDTFALTDLESELVALVQRSRGKPIARKALTSLALLGSESALDAFVANGGDGHPLRELADRLAPRYLRALEAEAATPWTTRFGLLAGQLASSPELARHTDMAAFRRVIDRAEAALAAETDDAQRRRISTNLDSQLRPAATAIERLQKQQTPPREETFDLQRILEEQTKKGGRK